MAASYLEVRDTIERLAITPAIIIDAQSRYDDAAFQKIAAAREEGDESRAVENLDEATGSGRVWREALALADAFALRVGGIAADMWAALPAAVERLGADDVPRLFRQAESFLDRGGTAALNVLVAGGEVLRLVPGVFDEWGALLRAVAAHNNACLVSLARRSMASRTRRLKPAASKVTRYGPGCSDCTRKIPSALVLAE